MESCKFALRYPLAIEVSDKVQVPGLLFPILLLRKYCGR